MLGKPVAVDGDMTFCPQCRGTFPIKTSHSERTHNGKEVAYDGHRTGCGAKLISSI
ncbi:PAAR domain-containing protein [Pseudoduganella sp. R-31]|uniref:PAAR domain-containing protein n=1 Tax=Pseudoduganella sp. R-31 TaxID=3404060 RepID=UPI003CE89BF8